MTPKKFFSMQQTGREADIYIFGDITSERLSQQDVSAFSLAQQIKDADADAFNVYIDSCGGDVSEGWAIYNQLRQHPAKVRTYGVGFVASAALYPFLAGDERYAVDPSAYFLHQVVVAASGYAEDLRGVADAADQMTEIGLAPFVQAGIDADCVREMMQRETWLSPQGALDCGIATGILTHRADSGMMQSAKSLIIQRLLQSCRPSASANEAPETVVAIDGSVVAASLLPVDSPNPVTQPSGIMQMLGGMFNL